MPSVRFAELRASKLIDADTFGGKSDAFCVVKVGGTEQKTEVVDDNKAPTWKKQAQWKPFSIGDPWKSDVLLEFTVWDDDPVGKDFLGRVVVPLKSVLPPKPTGAGPHKLDSKGWARDTGAELGPREGNASDAKLKQKKGTLGHVHFALVFEEEVAVGSTAVMPSKTGSALPAKQEVAPTLSFAHASAENLIPDDGSTSDPYLVMKLPGFSTTEYRSETLQKTLCPTWAKPKGWSLDLGGGVIPMMEFFVYDHDSISSDDFIGYASKQLAPKDLKHGCETSFTLSLTVRPGHQADDAGLFKQQKDEARRSQRSLGVLKLSVAFQGDPAKLRVPAGNEGLTLKPLYDKFAASLSVNLLRGVGLAAVGGGKDLTPYVEIVLEDSKGLQIGGIITTQKVDDSTGNQLDPVWNHEYVHLEDVRDLAKVHFYVKHSRMLGDIHCGYGMLPLARGRPSKDSKCIVALKPRLGNDGDTDRSLLKKLQRNHFGELLIDYDYQVVKAGQQTPIMLQGSCAPILPKRRRLTVYIDQVQKLLWKGENVIVKLQLGNRVVETPSAAKSEGVNANIRYSFEADVDKEFVRGTVSVYASGMLGKDCMGVAPIDINLRKNPNKPTALVAELQPGNIERCIDRLNEHIATGDLNSLGTVSLSYQLLDVDAKVDGAAMSAAAKAGPKDEAAKQPKAGDSQIDVDGDYDTSRQPPPGAAANAGAKTRDGWMLHLQISSAEGLPHSRHEDECSPYVIVRRLGAIEEEYKTCVVSHSADPKWHYTCQVPDVNKKEQILLTVFDHDAGGYDTFLGEAVLRVDELLKGEKRQLRTGAADLLPRKNADGTVNNTAATWGGMAPNKSTARLFFKWKMVPEQERVARVNKPMKPCVLDVFVHDATGLASGNAAKYASITLNDTDERQTCKDAESRWSQEFQYGMTKELNVLKVSVWEEGQFARYLGEASIEIDATAPPQGNQIIELEPRQDPHYNKEDVRLLNSSPSGLGTVTLSWCVRSGDTRRQFPMDPYTVILHVLEAADLPGASPQAQHFVTAQIKGGDNIKYSQVEQGITAKFRTQFEFQLRHDYDEMVVHLFRRQQRESKVRDSILATVTFPVGLSQTEASVSERTWCVMTPTENQAASATPRLLLMWKALIDSARPPQRQDVRQHRSAPKSPASYPLPMADEESRPCAYESNMSRHPHNDYPYPSNPLHDPPGGYAMPVNPYTHTQTSSSNGALHVLDGSREDPEKDMMRKQLSTLAAENQHLQEELRSLRGLLEADQVQRVSVSVEHVDTRRSVLLRVALPTDARTVLDMAKRELDLPLNSDYVLRWMGHEVLDDDPMHSLSDGDTLLLVRSDRFLTRRSPRFGRGLGASLDSFDPNRSSHRCLPVATPLQASSHMSPLRDVARIPTHPHNTSVLSRLQVAASARQEHFTVALWVPRLDDSVVITAASRLGFAGFARPHPAKANYTEVVLQGAAAEISVSVEHILDQADKLGAAVELVEVKGFIPLLTSRFLATSDFDEGARMWEKCCRPANIPGAGKKAWFYRSTDGIGDNVPGIVVIDERA